MSFWERESGWHIQGWPSLPWNAMYSSYHAQINASWNFTSQIFILRQVLLRALVHFIDFLVDQFPSLPKRRFKKDQECIIHKAREHGVVWAERPRPAQWFLIGPAPGTTAPTSEVAEPGPSNRWSQNWASPCKLFPLLPFAQAHWGLLGSMPAEAQYFSFMCNAVPAPWKNPFGGLTCKQNRAVVPGGWIHCYVHIACKE